MSGYNEMSCSLRRCGRKNYCLLNIWPIAQRKEFSLWTYDKPQLCYFPVCTTLLFNEWDWKNTWTDKRRTQRIQYCIPMTSTEVVRHFDTVLARHLCIVEPDSICCRKIPSTWDTLSSSVRNHSRQTHVDISITSHVYKLISFPFIYLRTLGGCNLWNEHHIMFAKCPSCPVCPGKIHPSPVPAIPSPWAGYVWLPVTYSKQPSFHMTSLLLILRDASTACEARGLHITHLQAISWILRTMRYQCILFNE